jgi:hypothetical protein
MLEVVGHQAAFGVAAHVGGCTYRRGSSILTAWSAIHAPSSRPAGLLLLGLLRRLYHLYAVVGRGLVQLVLETPIAVQTPKPEVPPSEDKIVADPSGLDTGLAAPSTQLSKASGRRPRPLPDPFSIGRD